MFKDKLNLKYFILSSFIIVLNGQTVDQINQVKKVMKSKNISIEDAKKKAREQGYSDSQIDRVIELDKKQNKEKIVNTQESTLNDFNTEETNFKSINDFENFDQIRNENELKTYDAVDLDIVDENVIGVTSKLQSQDNSSEYFGYDIFKKDPSIFQSSSVGVVDPDYLIGPGDEIIVMLWGETQFRQVLKVDREGFIFIPEIGQVFVNGLNLKLLESKLFRVLSQSYASLNPLNGKATTFIDVSIGNLRPLRIQVLGEVSQPGGYTISPNATLFSALYYFKGPTKLGTLRNIQLIRRGEIIGEIDFYDYLLTGRKIKDKKLQLDDVIFISKRLKTIGISGQINRSGIYELKDNETLKDLIGIAGDLNVTAYLGRAQVDRIVPFEERAQIGMDRVFIDVNLEEILYSKDDFELKDGDKIKIFSVLDLRQNTISISGAVTRPGQYDLGDSLSLKQLIEKAEGLLGDAYDDRVDIVRTNPDNTEKLIKLNLKEVLSEDINQNIYLNSLDRIRIYSRSEMIDEKTVSIDGHIKRPGKYLLQDNMTLYDLIFKADGFLDELFKSETYLKRAELIRLNRLSNEKEIIPFSLGDVLNNGNVGKKLLLPDDYVRIYSKSEIKGDAQYVSILGNVKRPGRYELYEENMRINDLIFKAGGFDDPQFKASTFLERADLIRYDEDRIKKVIIPFNLGDIIKDPASVQNINLFAGDLIRVYNKEVFISKRAVTIDGAIKNPGTYELKSGMSVKDLILEAGGMTENTFKYKIEIARIEPDKINDKTYARIIQLEMFDNFDIPNSKIKTSTSRTESIISNGDFLLMAYDYISIQTDPYFKTQRQVEILGEVLYPGFYTITKPEEKLSNIIERAGGVLPEAYLFGSSFFRENKKVNVDIEKIIKKPNSKNDLNVMGGDKIYINKKSGLVEIIGEVNSAGNYYFINGLRIKDIIDGAGGLTVDADMNSIFIRYPNGISKKYKGLFTNYKVREGSTIYVGEKPEEEPFDKTEYFKELTSILSNIVQAVSIILLAQR